MPYLVRGNAQQIAALFDKTWLFGQEADTPAGEAIDDDLARSFFLGGQAAFEHYVSAWRKAQKSKVYTQGDMTAANLFLLLNDKPLFKKENEDSLEYQKNIVALSFAYLNEQQEPCGLTLYYRKDDPAQWLIAHSKNTAATLDKRQIALLASFNLRSFFTDKPHAPIAVDSVDGIPNPLLTQLASPLVKKFLEQGLLNTEGEINPTFARMAHLLRRPRVDGQGQVDDPLALEAINPQSFFAENPGLDLITEHNLPLSSKLLMECLSKSSDLSTELESLKLTHNHEINACLLRITLHCYERGILTEYRDVVQAQLIDKARAGAIFNDEQIQLATLLIQKKYRPELMQQILAQHAYYTAVTELINLELPEDLPTIFANPVKRAELGLIDSVTEPNLKQLCLVFWVKWEKGRLHESEYKAIIKAGETYPLLAKTLVALDKTGVVSISELKALALNPQKHLQQSIIHHFAQDYPVNKIVLDKLSERELTRLNDAFVVLKGKTGVQPAAFDEAARDNEQAQLLRLFLPSLSGIYKQAYRDQLIDLLYEGIQTGPITLDKQIVKLEDQKLKVLAMDLRNRVLCAKQMQKLDLGDELISLAAAPNEDGAKRFRKVILKVEEVCKKINTRLDAKADEEQRKAWQKTELDYRKTLYNLAYKAIKNPSYAYASDLEDTEREMLELVEPEVKSWLQKILNAIANVVLYALGLVSHAHEKKPSMSWFFNRTASGDDLRYLDKDIQEPLRGPK